MSPLPSGYVAPAQLVKDLSGDNYSALGGDGELILTPFSPTVNDGEGSFSTLPIILRDQTLTYTGSLSLRQSVKFETFNSSLMTIISGLIAEEVVSSLPLQYHTNAPLAIDPIWSVRYTDDLGPDPLNEVGSAIGVWVPLNTSRRYGIFRPSSGTRTNTSRYQLALTADLIPKAQADITLVYIRV